MSLKYARTKQSVLYIGSLNNLSILQKHPRHLLHYVPRQSLFMDESIYSLIRLQFRVPVSQGSPQYKLAFRLRAILFPTFFELLNILLLHQIRNYKATFQKTNSLLLGITRNSTSKYDYRKQKIITDMIKAIRRRNIKSGPS